MDQPAFVPYRFCRHLWRRLIWIFVCVCVCKNKRKRQKRLFVSSLLGETWTFIDNDKVTRARRYASNFSCPFLFSCDQTETACSDANEFKREQKITIQTLTKNSWDTHTHRLTTKGSGPVCLCLGITSICFSIFSKDSIRFRYQFNIFLLLGFLLFLLWDARKITRKNQRLASPVGSQVQRLLTSARGTLVRLVNLANVSRLIITITWPFSLIFRYLFFFICIYEANQVEMKYKTKQK